MAAPLSQRMAPVVAFCSAAPAALRSQSTTRAFAPARSPARRSRSLRWSPARRARPVHCAAAVPASDKNELPHATSGSAKAGALGADGTGRVAPLPPSDPERVKAGTFLRLLGITLQMSKAEPFIVVRLALALGCVLLSKVVGLSAPFLLKRAIDQLSVGTGTVGVSAAAGRAALLSLVMHGIAKILASLSHEMRNGVFAKAGQRLGRRITLSCFEHLLSLDAKFHNSSRTGALTRIVDRGTRSVLIVYRCVVFAFIPTAFELMLVCGVFFTRFSLNYVAVLLLTFAVYCKWTVTMSEVLGGLRGKLNELDNTTASKATDSLYNWDTVALFNARSLEVSTLDVSLKTYEDVAVKNEWMYATQNVVQTLLYTCGLTAILVIGAVAVANGTATTTVGDLVMMSTLLAQLWVPCQYFGWQYREVMQAGVDVGNLFNVLETESDVTDDGQEILHVSRGEIVFDNVSFSYPREESSAEDNPESDTSRDLVLKNLSFNVPAGRTVALVGPSGAGKSSIIQLCSRIYDPGSGSILIDGQDITKVSLDSLRRNVSVVPQRVTIWNDTVTYNLLYGRPEATMEEVVAAAKAAELHDTIMKMPLGYDTVLGEKGVRMSGGEAQRLSAARALLKQSNIILCDEWTASLDSRTEAELTKSLNAVKGLTRLVVAHRLSTIFDADLIIVLRAGSIVEQGSHNDLLQIANGVYADMWRRQSEVGLQGKEDSA